VALAGLELGEEAGVAARSDAASGIDLDLALDHDEPRPLVDLGLLEGVAGRQTEHDGAGVRALEEMIRGARGSTGRSVRSQLFHADARRIQAALAR
jgi:hypothetical protein